MFKHLQKMALLAVMMLLPWMGQAQVLIDYTFTTGVDQSKWISVPASTTSLLSTTGDGVASAVTSLGFNFPFGEGTYSQFSVNSDGNLRFGATATATSNYTTPFSSTNANVNNPKINFFGCDGYANSSHYVRYLHTVNADGDSVGVVEFCVGTYTSTTRDQMYLYQIQLYHNGNIVVVYGTQPSLMPAVSRQPGLCSSAADGWYVSDTHVGVQFTNGTTSTTPTGVWPTLGRYYSFVRPVVSCPAPLNVHSANISAYAFDVQWQDANASEWVVRYYAVNDGMEMAQTISATTTTVSLTGLTPNTDYSVSVASICDNGDTSSWRSILVTSGCAPMTSLPYFMDFESCATTTTTSTDFVNCWNRLNNGTTYFGYPTISSTAISNHTIGGARGLYW